MKEVAEEPPDTKTGVGWATECRDRSLNRTARGEGDWVHIELSMTVQQREGDGKPELNPQEGRNPEESYC